METNTAVVLTLYVANIRILPYFTGTYRELNLKLLFMIYDTNHRISEVFGEPQQSEPVYFNKLGRLEKKCINHSSVSAEVKFSGV